MSTRLVILGLLKRRDLHGYEIKHIIEEHMGDWSHIAFGSIYFALGKLKKKGLVTVVSEERAGNRPSRTVFGITENGREEFYRLLRNQWRENPQQTYAFDIALFFSSELEKEERVSLLLEKISSLESILEYICFHKNETVSNADIPPSAAAIFDHSIVHTEAELNWLKDLLIQIREDRV